MRIAVIGDNDTAKSLRANLRTQFKVVDSGADYTIRVDEKSNVDGILFDSVDCPMELEILRSVRKLTRSVVSIQTVGGNQSDRDVFITVPMNDEDRRAVEIGVFRGVCAFFKTPHAKRSWIKRLATLFLLAVAMHGQTATVTTYTDSSRNRITAGDSANNALRVNCVTGCTSGGGGAVNITGINGVAPSVGTGATDSGTLRVVLGATQPSLAVTGPLTDAQIRATPLPVNGTVAVTQSTSPWVTSATQSGTWTVQPGNTANSTPWLFTVSQGGNSATVSAGGALKVDGSAATQPVSGTVTANQGGAPWSVSGSGNFTVVQGTGTNLHSVVDSGAVTVSTIDTSPATQNITAQDVVSATTSGANSQSIITGTPTAGSTASFTISGLEAIKMQVTGTWTGTLQSEISLDGGTTWYINGIHQSGTAYTVATWTANFAGGLNVSGVTQWRLRATAAWTGTATVKVVGTQNVNSIYVANGLNLQDGTTQSQKLSITSRGSLLAEGAVASAGSNAGNPVKIAGVFNTAQPTVTNGQIVDVQSTARGAQIVATGADTFNVTVNAALPAGTNAIGKLAANSGVDIGDVDPNTPASWAIGATAVAAPANASYSGAVGKSAQPTAVSDGQLVGTLAALDGALYARPYGPIIWSCGVTNIAATLTQCQGVPGAGLSLYITDVVTQSNTSTAGLFTLRFGTGTNCGTGTGNLFFGSASALMASPANTAPVNHFHLTTPIKLTANNAVCVLGVATNTTNAQITGFTAP